MDNAFTTIIQTLVTEQGKEALFNAARCKAILADYTHNEYKKESRLLLQAIETGVAEAVSNTDNIASCKAQAVRKLQDEYFLAENIALDVVDMLTLVLRGDTTPTQAVAQPASWPSPPPSVSAPSQAVQIPQTASAPHKNYTKRNALIAAGVVVVVVGIILIISKNASEQTLAYTVGTQPAETTNTANAKTMYDKGEEFYDAENYDAAIDYYTRAIGIDPQYARAYAGRGNAYRMKHDYDRAIQDLNKAIELDPQYARAYADRGFVYNNKGDYDHAIQEYNKTIELDPQYAWAYSARGDAYRMKGDYDRAIQEYNKTIELDPQYAWAYSARGAAYLNKGDYNRAITDYEKALQINPDLQTAKNGLAKARQARGW